MKIYWDIIISPYTILVWGIQTFSGAVGGSFKFAQWVRKRFKKDKPTHGDAKFADDKTLMKKGYMAPKAGILRRLGLRKSIAYRHGMLMGVTKSGKRIFTRHERSVMIMAQPGAGKSHHMIADIKAQSEAPRDRLPFLLVGDAGNEVYKYTWQRLKASGYQLSKIDLVRPMGMTRYDFLAELDTQLINRHLFKRKLQMICESMVPTEHGSKQPHFVDFARLLLKCAITADVLYEGNQRTIVQIVRMILDDDERESLLKRAKGYGDTILSAALKTMERMQTNSEGTSIMSTAIRKLDPWLDDAIDEITTFGRNPDGTYNRGWNFTKMYSQTQPVALFIRSGYQDAGAHLSRLVYECAVDAVAGIWDDTDQPLSRKLFVYVDEAGLTGYCASLVKAFSRLRKVGAHLRLCFVGLDEMKDVYPQPHYKTLLNGSDLIVMSGGNDLDLGEYASKLAGDYTGQNRSETEGIHGDSKGRSETAIRLIKPAEIRGMDRTEALVFLDNLVVKPNLNFRIKSETEVEHL